MSDSSHAVFLSYASQDAEAAKRIADALRAAQVEVWFDQSELVGGDAWDQKIRRQIRECALFVPIISANTQARREGYFRIEWKLAAQRTHAIAEGTPFLLPILIDDTPEPQALVPAEFREVQWTRLRGGESTTAFAERVQELLDQRGLTARKEGAPGSLTASTLRSFSRSRSRWVLALAVGGFAAAAFFGWRSWHRPATALSGPRAPTTVRVEARALLGKAWLHLDAPDLNRAELEIADDLCKRAADIDPADPEVWATWSQVATWYVYHGVDTSAERKESARTKAARALTIDSQSFEARLAEACYVVRATSGRPGIVEFDSSVSLSAAEASLRELLRERPREPRVLFGLGILLRNTGKFDEGSAVFDQMAETPKAAATALSEKGWLLWRARKYPEALAAADQSIAVLPFRGNLLLRTTAALFWQGDLELSQAVIQRFTSSALREDGPATIAARVFWARREPAEMLRVLKTIQRPWLTWTTAPKSYLVGRAQEMMGEGDAARFSWNEALRVVEQRLVNDPESFALFLWRAQLLALLGRAEEARRALQLARGFGYTGGVFHSLLSDVSVLLSLDDRETALDVLEAKYPTENWGITWAALRFDPVYDPLREHPRFKALLARAEADPARCPRVAKPMAKAGAARVVEPRSVAVLAFENRSSEKDSEYFSDGISEELLNVLSKVPGLRVAARTSSFYFKGKTASLKEIARELNVTHLVEGSVQRSGSRARIGASLFRADTGDTIWTDRFDTELKDIFTAQDEIARLIASKLSLNLSGPSRPARVVDPAMHGLVLEGRYFLTQRDTGFPRAEAAFARALKLDPEFAPAHAGLAAVHVLKAVFRIIDGVGGNAAGLAEGRRFAQQALALDVSLVDAHSTAGYEALLSGRFNESEQHFQRGLAVNPNDAFTHHWRAHLLARLGQLDRALEENALAAELDPFSWALLSGYSGQLALACRHQDTLTALERLLAIRPNFLPAQGLAAVQMLRLGRSAEAIALARQVLENPQASQRQWADVSAVQVLHEAQLDGDVRTYAAKVLASYPAEDPRRPALLAAAGRFEEALVTPIKSPVDPFNARFYFWAEAWDPIRDEPRFEHRIAQLGLTKEYKVARETLQRMLKQPKLKKP